jgi:hypothetical protein
VISFIVPVKNELAYTRALVDTVRAQNPGVEVEWVVVDSGSTDGTLEYLAGIDATVVPFRSTPFNYCAAVNAGAERAAGDLWIISNNDIEWRSPGDLERIERILREWPLVSVLSPGRPSGEAELEFLYGGINGACWVVRPESFRAWGGMPESMSGYGYDEAYTMFQCWRRGFGIAWLTGWDVLHHGSVTFGPAAGNVTPALRRNLSRLLKAMDAEDLDGSASPERIMNTLRARELARAPCRLGLLQRSVPGGAHLLARQGYANAQATRGDGPGTVGAWVPGLPAEPDSQYLPWLANELLLQPEAVIVGTDECFALRLGEREYPDPDQWEEYGLEPHRRAKRSVGPPPPRLMPALERKRPTVRQRLSAALHAWRQRSAALPEEW